MKSISFDQIKNMLKSMSLSIFNRMGKLENKLDPPDKPIKHIYATDENGNAGWNSAAEMLGNVKPIIITRMYDENEPYYMCNFTVDEIWDLDADVIQHNTRVIDGDNQYAVRGVNKIEERLYGKTIQFTVDLNAAYYDLGSPPFTSVILTLMYGHGKKMLSEQTQVLQRDIDATKPFQRNDCLNIPTNSGYGWNVSKLLGVKERSNEYSVPVILNVVSSDYLALSSNYTRQEIPTYNIDIDRVSVVQAAKNGELSDVVLCYTDSHEASVGKVTTLDRLEISGATNTYADVTFIMKPDENGKYARITLDEKNAGKAIVEWAQSDTIANKKAGEGLKIVGDALTVDEGEYELIEEINITEDVGRVIRTSEPDGTPYNLKQAYVVFTSPVYTENRRVYIAIGSTDSTDVWNVDDRLLYFYHTEMINKTGLTTLARLINDRGKYLTLLTDPAKIPNIINVKVSTFVQSLDAKESNNIKAIRIFANGNETNLIPTGTKIEIWGVRS